MGERIANNDSKKGRLSEKFTKFISSKTTGSTNIFQSSLRNGGFVRILVSNMNIRDTNRIRIRLMNVLLFSSKFNLGIHPSK